MNATLERLRERREQGEGGFTLIELLIVIVILAILAAIVVFAVQNLTGSSAKASCKADFKTVESAAEAFKAQEGAYPGGTTNFTTTAAADANGYTSPANTATQGFNGVGYLTQTTDIQGTGGPSVGPWLKDWPVNKGHYEIVVSYPIGAGTSQPGTVSVYVADGSAQIGTTNSAADCDAVT